MTLTKQEEEIYKKAMDESKKKLESIDPEIEKEIQKTKEHLAKLQESKSSYRQIYEGGARLLGLDVKLEDDKETRIRDEINLNNPS